MKQLTLDINMHAVLLTGLNYCVMIMLMMMIVVLLKIETIYYLNISNIQHLNVQYGNQMQGKFKIFIPWSQMASEIMHEYTQLKKPYNLKVFKIVVSYVVLKKKTP